MFWNCGVPSPLPSALLLKVQFQRVECLAKLTCGGFGEYEDHSKSTSTAKVIDRWRVVASKRHQTAFVTKIGAVFEEIDTDPRRSMRKSMRNLCTSFANDLPGEVPRLLGLRGFLFISNLYGDIAVILLMMDDCAESTVCIGEQVFQACANHLRSRSARTSLHKEIYYEVFTSTASGTRRPRIQEERKAST